MLLVIRVLRLAKVLHFVLQVAIHLESIIKLSFLLLLIVVDVLVVGLEGERAYDFKCSLIIGIVLFHVHCFEY